MEMIIGIDFDNTIVSYHDIFHKVAWERCLIDQHFPKNKEKIRDYLRQQGQEDQWTELQGYVYGKRMQEARPFPGMLDFFKMAKEKNISLYIVSHKTRYPYRGPQYDLHTAAYQWLEQYPLGLDASRIFFVETKKIKCEYIAKYQCTHFIDDLPEILLDINFPKAVHKLLFTPESTGHPLNPNELMVFNQWGDIQKYFLKGIKQ